MICSRRRWKINKRVILDKEQSRQSISKVHINHDIHPLCILAWEEEIALAEPADVVHTPCHPLGSPGDLTFARTSTMTIDIRRVVATAVVED